MSDQMLGDVPKNNGDDAFCRLLDSAERLFAESGFSATSVRQITADAECNIAAINYHFGSKENLYIEIFRRRLVSMRQVRVGSVERVMSGPKDGITLEGLLEAFAGAFLEPLVDEETGRSLLKLAVRERLDPQLPGQMFHDEMIGPVVASLLKALMEISPRLDQAGALMSVSSYIAQLLHIVFMHKMHPGALQEFSDLSMDMAVDHIVRFSAAGIRACAGGEDA